MPSFSFLEEFSVIRAKYKTVFSDLMQAAARTTGTDVRNILFKVVIFSFLLPLGKWFVLLVKMKITLKH